MSVRLGDILELVPPFSFDEAPAEIDGMPRFTLTASYVAGPEPISPTPARFTLTASYVSGPEPISPTPARFTLTASYVAAPVLTPRVGFTLGVTPNVPGAPLPRKRPRFSLRVFGPGDFLPIVPAPARFTLTAYRVNAELPRVGFRLGVRFVDLPRPRPRLSLSVRTNALSGGPLSPATFAGVFTPFLAGPIAEREIPMSNLMVPKASALLAAAALKTGWLDDTHGKIKLYSVDHVPAYNDTVADFTESTFTGYAVVSTVAWNAPVLDDDGKPLLVATAPVSFNFVSADPLTDVLQDVYGWTYHKLDGTLVFAQRFDTPQPMRKDGDNITFLPVARPQVGPGAVLNA